MPRLIINADDFGLTAGVNRAIVECYHAGAITSTTMMANAHAFDGAVAAASKNPLLGVGCHVVLVDGEPLRPSRSVSSLIARGGSSFRIGIAGFAQAALRGRLDPEQIYSEACAQFQKIQAAGIQITHFDSHKHTHMFPPVLRPLLRAAKDCGVRAVRNPFVPLKALAFSHFFRRPKLWVRYSEVRFLRRYADEFRREADAAGLMTTDGTFGIIATGTMNKAIFEAIMGSIPDGTWEFVCHPGYNDSDLSRIRTRLRESRASELAMLTSADSQRLIHERGIELISYADL